MLEQGMNKILSWHGNNEVAKPHLKVANTSLFKMLPLKV
jgi:hypothetical protein